ncbi:MFS transporter [Pararhodospirillum photometricum]|nr:MFS transporter [Pararhodospirillum photometricum]
MTRVDTTPATSGRALLLVFLAAVIEGFDLQSAGVAAPKLVPVFSLTPNQIGLFFSAATVGLIVGALAGGRIADAWGRRAGLVLSLVTFGLFSLATALAASFDQLLIMRFLTGVGLGGALPNLVNIADEAAGPARRARAVALMYAGVPLGGALAGLTVLSGLQGTSWSFIFMVGGVLPLLLAPVVYLGLPALRGTTAVRRGMGDSLKDIVAPPVLFASLALWVSFFLGLLVVYLLLNWLPQLLVAHGLTRADASWVQVVFNIGGVIGSLVGGRLLDRRHPLIPVGLGFAATAIALLMIAFLPPSLGWMLLGGGLVGGTILCVQAVLYGMAPQCYPFSSRGTGVGVAVAMGRLGSIAGPLLAGVLVAGGSSPADVMVALVPIILCAGGTTLMLIARHRREVVPA